jgi:hypothetical protein
MAPDRQKDVQENQEFGRRIIAFGASGDQEQYIGLGMIMIRISSRQVGYLPRQSLKDRNDKQFLARKMMQLSAERYACFFRYGSDAQSRVAMLGKELCCGGQYLLSGRFLLLASRDSCPLRQYPSPSVQITHAGALLVCMLMQLVRTSTSDNFGTPMSHHLSPFYSIA